MQIIKGMPIKWGETGTEGHYFAIQANSEKEKWSYDDLHLLKNGDYLILFQAGNVLLWEGVIDLDLQHRLSDGHGYQRDHHEDWEIPFRKRDGNYHAILVRKDERI